MRLTSAHVTVALALSVTCTAVLSGTAATLHHSMAKHAAKHAAAKKPAGSNLISEGKQLASARQCNTCHAPDYSGKKGFSPSLKSDGVLHEYNKKTWETVLNTGVTNDGGKVRPPMPVYHMKPAQSDALYVFFKTLK